MFVETSLMIVGALASSAIGIPLAVRLARPWAFGRYASPDSSLGRRLVEARRAFEPLDLGPDPMRWPSEVERPKTAMPEPLWPSQHWDDAHFGAHWRKYDGGASRPSDAEARRATRAPAQDIGRQTVATLVDRAGQAARDLMDLAPAAVDETRPPPLVRAQPTPDVPRAVSVTGPPSMAELEELVAKVGLAGTVQTIMKRTGWDFRQSAQYLAKVRQAK